MKPNQDMNLINERHLWIWNLETDGMRLYSTILLRNCLQWLHDTCLHDDKLMSIYLHFFIFVPEAHILVQCENWQLIAQPDAYFVHVLDCCRRNCAEWPLNSTVTCLRNTVEKNYNQRVTDYLTLYQSKTWDFGQQHILFNLSVQQWADFSLLYGFQSQHNTTRSAFNAERGWGVDLSVGRDFGKVVAKTRKYFAKF